MALTALIVTDRQSFFRPCENSFNNNDVYVKLLPAEGRERREKLEGTQPNILLVDAAQEEQALEQIDRVMAKAADPKPALFVCVEKRTANWEWTFVRKGAVYVFDRAMPENMMVDCIMSLCGAHRAELREERVTPELVRLLRQCHISPRHRGYRCIFDCVQLMHRYEDKDQLLTKKIYPQVAKKQGTTSTRVEKNIRDAIRGGWENGGKEDMPLLLGCGRDKTPTNGEFLFSLCEKMTENLHNEERAGREPALV